MAIRPRSNTALQACFAALFVLIAAPLAHAAEPDVDADAERYEPTPTALPELIEGVGLEAVDWDVWSIHQYERGFHHIRDRAYVDGDVLVFAEYVHGLGETYAMVYFFSLDGELLVMRSGGYDRVVGGRDQWKWSLEIRYCEGEVRVLTDSDGFEVKKRDFEFYDNVIHNCWVPLAIRYHITLSHEQFEVPVGRRVGTKPSVPWVQRFVSLGDEEMEVLGEAVACRVFEYSDRPGEDMPESEQDWKEYRVYTHDGQVVRDWWGDGDPEGEGGWRRVESGVIPEGLADFPAMIEGDIGNDVFGVVEVGEDDPSADDAEAE